MGRSYNIEDRIFRNWYLLTTDDISGLADYETMTSEDSAVLLPRRWGQQDDCWGYVD